jgi:hypothetical protein
MMRATRGLLTLALLLGGAACGAATSAGTGAETRPRSRSTQITVEEIRQRGQYSNLYDVVQVLRPRWLRSQGPDTMLGQQGRVQVHMDGNRLGGVAVLRNISPSGVTSLQWIPPIDAAGRFGFDHSHGAIIISTAPVH